MEAQVVQQVEASEVRPSFKDNCEEWNQLNAEAAKMITGNNFNQRRWDAIMARMDQLTGELN